MNVDTQSMIVQTPEVLGGRPRIEGTRVAVRTIAILYKQGLSPEEIAGQYRHLSLAQVYAALAYYQANQNDIEGDIAAEQAEYDRLAGSDNQDRRSA